MIGILHKDKTADSMLRALDKIQDKLSCEEYQKLFSLLLTDRGTEFSKPQQFEINMETGEIRSKIFYCDSQQSSQKPHVENNHNFIREILSNGRDWSNLTQDKIDLMFSHINSTPRESLGDKTPYEIFTFIYGRELADKLHIQEIAKDELIFAFILLFYSSLQLFLNCKHIFHLFFHIPLQLLHLLVYLPQL